MQQARERKDMAKILIIDDEEVIQEIARRALESEDHTVFLAKDGEEGLESFKENFVDLVLTDIMMPESDGFFLLQELDKIAPNTKVILMSAWFDEKEMERITDEYGSMVKKVVSKPFQLDTIREAVKEVLRG